MQNKPEVRNDALDDEISPSRVCHHPSSSIDHGSLSLSLSHISTVALPLYCNGWLGSNDNAPMNEAQRLIQVRKLASQAIASFPECVTQNAEQLRTHARTHAYSEFSQLVRALV